MTDAKAAIPPDDKLMGRSLGELSAVEFLQILQRGDLGIGVAQILPDKKKYELWVEESIVTKIPIGDLIDRIRKEKKKLELEKLRIEDVIDPIGPVINPAVIDQIAQQVAIKIRSMR